MSELTENLRFISMPRPEAQKACSLSEDLHLMRVQTKDNEVLRFVLCNEINSDDTCPKTGEKCQCLEDGLPVVPNTIVGMAEIFLGLTKLIQKEKAQTIEGLKAEVQEALQTINETIKSLAGDLPDGAKKMPYIKSQTAPLFLREINAQKAVQ